MIKIELDMYQTLAVAVLVLMLGAYLKSKIYFLEKFCIPAPVIGGLLFAIFTSYLLHRSMAELHHSMIFCAKYAWYFSLLP